MTVAKRAAIVTFDLKLSDDMGIRNNEEHPSAQETLNLSSIVCEGLHNLDVVAMAKRPAAGRAAQGFRPRLALHQSTDWCQHEPITGRGEDVSWSCNTIWDGAAQSRHDYGRR